MIPTVFSLWELMETFKLNTLAVLLMDLRGCRDDCENGRIAAADIKNLLALKNPPQLELDHILKCLNGLVDLCGDIGLDNAVLSLALIVSHHQEHPGEADYSSWCADLRNAEDAVMSELWSHKAIQIKSEFSEYVNNDQLFGKPVADAFPSAVPDIQEAGNCLSVGCYTACVFHLMRVAEYGLRALAHDRRITVAKKKPVALATWDDVLKELEDAENLIRGFPRTKAREAQFDFFHGAMMELKRFKNKFRNRIMHSRQSYDMYQARSTFDHVKAFMEILASRISENKRTPVVWKGLKWVNGE